MSIFGALFAGVTGLSSNATALSVISDNIANVNTVGYKRNTANFSTLVTGGGVADQFSPGGVRAGTGIAINQQGLLQNSTSSTDIAISGAGFFAVSPNTSSTGALDEILFTRAGSFRTDQNGNLRNAAGYFLQGFPVQPDGTVNFNPSDLTLLETVNIDSLGGTAEATTLISPNANLQSSLPISSQEATYAAGVSGTNMASGNVTPDFQRSVQFFDSLGGLRTLTMSFLKSSTPNQWHTELHVEPASDVVTGAGLVDGQVAVGTLAFTSDGQIDLATTSAALSNFNFLASGATPGAGQVAFAPALGVSAQAIGMDLGSPTSSGGFTQFDSPSILISSTANGAVFGNLSGVEIDQDGFVTALFDNGVRRQVYQLPVATFVNPNGLNAVEGNAYGITSDSGPINLRAAGTAGAGLIAPSALEASTVDIAEEFTGLITIQRAYSANTRVVTTADELLEELIRIV